MCFQWVGVAAYGFYRQPPARQEHGPTPTEKMELIEAQPAGRNPHQAHFSAAQRACRENTILA